MNVVPAQVAGVDSLALASPPQKEPGPFQGLPHPAILAACALLGVEEVYAVGGAQAIAMFAYGAAESDGTLVCRPVDLVTGPGNIYVAAAKRLLRGRIGIDAEAGPDRDRHPRRRHRRPAARRRRPDQPGRARHRSPPRCSSPTARRWWPRWSASSRTRSRPPSTPSGSGPRLPVPSQGSCSSTTSTHGLRVVDAYAAEHLEIQTRDARSVATAGPQRRRHLRRSLGAGVPRRLRRRVQPRAAHRRVRAALQRPVGADLPARHPRHRLRPRPRWPRSAHHVVALAGAEDLPAHGAAVEIRFPTESVRRART